MSPVQELYDQQAETLIEMLRRAPVAFGKGEGIYFLHAPFVGTKGLIKIGHSATPHQRAAEIAAHAPGLVEVTRVVEGLGFHDEDLLWHHFAENLRPQLAIARGLPCYSEWFEPNAELCAIAGIS